jgi:hypothetical protein
VTSWNALTIERDTTLFNVTYKVFSNILYTRLLLLVESKLGHLQAGFYPKKSTTNKIFGLRRIVEEIKEFRISIHVRFTDFKSAYASIDREKMWVARNELNIPEKLSRLVKVTVSNL